MPKNNPPNGRRKTNSSPLTEADKKVWLAITKTVAPLRNDTPKFMADTADNVGNSPSSKNSKTKGYTSPVNKDFTIGKKASAKPTVNVCSARDLTHGDTTQMHKSQGRRFVRGQIPIDAKLDLHGMTQEKSHSVLNRFVIGAYHKGFRKIIVVTGKGKGVLQNAVPRWLNDDALKTYILSFSYAQPQDGGQGALYVLIRRNRKKQ